jgi:hypothetical protein
MAGVLIVALALFLCLRVLSSSFKYGYLIYFFPVITIWNSPDGLNLATVAGVNIFLSDGISIAALILYMWNINELREKYRSITLVTNLIFAIFCVSLFRGMFTFGVQQSVNESRFFLYVLTSMMWAIFCSTKLKPAFHEMVLVSRITVVALLALEGLNIYLHGFGGASEYIQTGQDGLVNLRPLVAIQALSLLAAISMLAFSALGAKKYMVADWSLAFLGLVGIIFSQQRSVWIATLATFCLFVLNKKTFFLGVGLVVTAAIVFFLIPFADLAFLPHAFRDQLSSSSSDLATFLARTGSWSQYLNSYYSYSWIDQLFGKPFGSGWGRYDGLNNLWVEFNPHNWYVTILLRTGVIGLALFTVNYLQKIWVVFRNSNERRILFVAQIQLLVFQNFYPAPWQIVYPIDDGSSSEKEINSGTAGPVHTELFSKSEAR